MTVIGNDKIRKIIKITTPVLLLTTALFCAIFASDGRKFAVITVICAVLTLLLFYAGFDNRRIGSRRLVLAAVFTALGIAGRFIPALKPVTALIIISGLYISPETGFLVGSLSALLSNLWFGHGPWTPMQMAALGLIGLFSGLFCKIIRKNRITLALYGVICGVFYSMFMDIWTVCSATGAVSLSEYIKCLYTALPFTAMYAVSNVIYLLLLEPLFCRKLSRVKEKYGL